MLFPDGHYLYFDLKDFPQTQRLAEEAIESSMLYDQQFQALSRVSLGRIIAKLKISEIEKAEDSILIGIKILEELKLRP
jgi:hypothetical protein